MNPPNEKIHNDLYMAKRLDFKYNDRPHINQSNIAETMLENMNDREMILELSECYSCPGQPKYARTYGPKYDRDAYIALLEQFSIFNCMIFLGNKSYKGREFFKMDELYAIEYMDSPLSEDLITVSQKTVLDTLMDLFLC